MRIMWSILFGLILSPLAWGLTNQLKDNPSPYLAIHGHDPVAWQEWNAKTIELARQENKLIYVSIGYFSCHWCHVMQRESYANPQIAAILNDNFIPVKIDRELMSALDGEMQAFSERTRGRSGWPLNVFITPEGFPLFATLYSPPDEFRQIVTRLRDSWLKEGAKLKVLAKQAALPKAKTNEPAEAKFSPAVGEHFRTQLIKEALLQGDIFRGGFGSANKFPQSPQLAALLEAYEQDPQPKLGEFLKLTLDQMASQGLNDHVAGGFFRYTTDPDWHIPHFEKMLYDNAQLALIYLRAAKIFEKPAYREIAYATLEFMLTDLREGNSKGLITSTSAIDENNQEGGVYLWGKESLQKLLSPKEFTLVNRIWGMDAPAEFDLGYLPVHKMAPNADERAGLVQIYDKLRTARKLRGLPKDEKKLTSLNSLALIALSEAGQTEPRFAAAAKEIRDFLIEEMWHENSLYKAKSKGQTLGEGELEDYAYAAAGLMSYASLTGAEKDFSLARKMSLQAWQRFYTKPGWKLQQTRLLPNQADEIVVADSATPSPASMLIRTSWHIKDKALRTLALSALNAGYAEIGQATFWYATQVAAMNSLQSPN